MDDHRQSDSYAFVLALIFFFTWGFTFLDRMTLAFLTPDLVKHMSLNNTQIGVVTMWQSIGYAIAAPLMGALSDRIGYRKRLVVLAVLFMSIFSGLTALAQSFSQLVVLRFLVGATEGGIMPIAIAMIRAASSPARFGRNVGIVYAGASVITAALGPAIVTQLTALTNWRMAFLLVSIPSFILAFVLWKFTAEVPRDTVSKSETMQEKQAIFKELLTYRNFILCVCMCPLFIGGLMLFASFGPLYLTTLGQLTEQTMGFVWSAFGLVGILWQLGLPIISDYTGRKPSIVIFCLVSAVTPLLMYLAPTGIISMISVIVIGGTITSITAFYASLIPNESLPPRLAATASAIILGIGELVGAFVVGIGGSLADLYGLGIVMVIAAVLFVLTALIGFFLIETKFRKVKSLGAPQAEALGD
jgi:predicted MFS family arabinose efflux permease